MKFGKQNLSSLGMIIAIFFAPALVGSAAATCIVTDPGAIAQAAQQIISIGQLISSTTALTGEQTKIGKTIETSEKKTQSLIVKTAAAPTPSATSAGDYARQEIIAMDPAVEEAATLLPDSGTIAIGDMQKARDMAVLLTDPEPPRTRALYGADTAEGRRYAADRRVRQARLSIARHVMADHVAQKAPTHDLSAWAQKMAVAGGKDQTAAAADIPSGRVSADTVLETLVAMRYASPNWAVNLHSLSTEGLLRETLMMEAVHAQIALRNLKLLQLSTIMAAQSLAREVTSDTGGNE